MSQFNEVRRQFGSDNYAGMCPEALAALAKANHGHVRGYGDDPWTAEATRLIRELFETQCEVFFVFNGTAANALALAALCQPYHSILCHEMSHVEMGERRFPRVFETEDLAEARSDDVRSNPIQDALAY